jgi:cell wall-associated NlpC family hydrolase
VQEPLWARNWARYGQKSPQASLGDVLVFQRPTGGHAGIYIAEDPQCYHVLGGNQSNAVTITRIMKSRCIAVRRPRYVAQPASVRPYHVAASGAISSNEA